MPQKTILKVIDLNNCLLTFYYKKPSVFSFALQYLTF